MENATQRRDFKYTKVSGNEITFHADKMQIRTRASDNALIVTFETGEYEVEKIAELMKLLTDTVYKITVGVK